MIVTDVDASWRITTSHILTACFPCTPALSDQEPLWRPPLCGVSQGVCSISLHKSGASSIPIGAIVAVLIVTGPIAVVAVGAMRLCYPAST
jgi:hypothetical protein